ncbi:FkbM family methyltransferase [Mesorhizobium sp. B3-1-3]|uniref:FkbM family methyltransferase n=1 Tax=unclassified Mesorhizobium TaxID=325217 RepID=UPI001129F2E9|nr:MULTISPECIES: FkbM family methyltransferase [unclassified Mesorhizobium]TPI60399.1 FkbM family methyltransferase [Mesorhizobium sp. B3-1-8]TPI68885.1 FkbM family methyltransferase [Mesorhizobium sp. B3-1-3]
MHSRKALETDTEVLAALSSWGARSISGLAAFILERMYRAETLLDESLFLELKKHVDYFSERAGVNLPIIINGSDFSVNKRVFLDFSENCAKVCLEIDKYDSILPSACSINSKILSIEDGINRIQSQLMIGSLVINSSNDKLRERIIGIGSLLSPVAVSGVLKRRIGGRADGGYVMLDDFKEVEGALSLGINDDDSWDADISNLGIEVHQYDHTIDGSPTIKEKLKFFKEKITSPYDSSGVSLRDAVLRQRGKKLVLKCDIEGSEWDVFSTADNETLERFSQIVCEFHGFGSIVNDELHINMERALKNLQLLFSVVHVHANNSGPWLIIGGVPFPSVIEVTFARKSLYHFNESTEIFPTALDFPNAPSLPDFYLGSFKYKRDG